MYIIGGSDSPTDNMGITYEVITVNLRTGEVGEAEDAIHAVNVPIATSSQNRIAVCGGKQRDAIQNYCQVYSPKNDE